MTSIVLLALIANTYFIQTDYSCHRDAVAYSVAVECSSVLVSISEPIGEVASYIEPTPLTISGKLGNTTTCKRPRDYLLHKYVQRDKTA